MDMNKVLKFSTHDFGILCYGGITNLELVFYRALILLLQDRSRWNGMHVTEHI
jgi:hypothetical protein